VSDTNVQAIKALILEDAAYWDAPMNEVKLRAWADQLAGIPASSVKSAMVAFRGEQGRSKMPMPADIKARITPGSSIDKRELATTLARKIDKALVAHGYVWEEGYLGVKGRYWEAFVGGKRQRFESFKEAVIAELGPIAWNAICERGGWQQMISSQREMDEGQFVAQLRDQVQSSYSLAEQGVDVTRIPMPSIERRSGDNALTAHEGYMRLLREREKDKDPK
jgi:hypothetical protein